MNKKQREKMNKKVILLTTSNTKKPASEFNFGYPAQDYHRLVNEFNKSEKRLLSELKRRLEVLS